MCDFGASAAAGTAATASTTAASVTAYAAIAGALVSAAGIYQQGQNAKKMSDYNADLTKVKADDALSAGAIAEDKQRAKVRQIQGAQTAQMGGSGGVIGEGNFGDILDQTSRFGELDALTTRSNALKAAWGLQTQANADTLQGALAANAGGVNAVGTLLSASPNIYKAGGKNGAGWW
jgi:dienelactone hydrolase